VGVLAPLRDGPAAFPFNPYFFFLFDLFSCAKPSQGRLGNECAGKVIPQ